MTKNNCIHRLHGLYYSQGPNSSPLHSSHSKLEIHNFGITVDRMTSDSNNIWIAKAILSNEISRRFRKNRMRSAHGQIHSHTLVLFIWTWNHYASQLEGSFYRNYLGAPNLIWILSEENVITLPTTYVLACDSKFDQIKAQILQIMTSFHNIYLMLLLEKD